MMTYLVSSPRKYPLSPPKVQVLPMVYFQCKHVAWSDLPFFLPKWRISKCFRDPWDDVGCFPWLRLHSSFCAWLRESMWRDQTGNASGYLKMQKKWVIFSQKATCFVKISSFVTKRAILKVKWGKIMPIMFLNYVWIWSRSYITYFLLIKRQYRNKNSYKM